MFTFSQSPATASLNSFGLIHSRTLPYRSHRDGGWPDHFTLKYYVGQNEIRFKRRLQKGRSQYNIWQCWWRDHWLNLLQHIASFLSYQYTQVQSQQIVFTQSPSLSNNPEITTIWFLQRWWMTKLKWSTRSPRCKKIGSFCLCGGPCGPKDGPRHCSE